MFDRILKDSTPIERTFHTECKDQSEDFSGQELINNNLGPIKTKVSSRDKIKIFKTPGTKL